MFRGLLNLAWISPKNSYDKWTQPLDLGQVWYRRPHEPSHVLYQSISECSDNVSERVLSSRPQSLMTEAYPTRDASARHSWRFQSPHETMVVLGISVHDFEL